jgi:hypothetical protein
MPFNYDFSKLESIKEIKVSPSGWVNPIIIEYGIGIWSDLQSFYWRVKGTTHTFTIPVVRMNYISKGNYELHFQEVLEAFREDYIGWSEENFYCEWMQQYRDNYSKYIIQ